MLKGKKSRRAARRALRSEKTVESVESFLERSDEAVKKTHTMFHRDLDEALRDDTFSFRSALRCDAVRECLRLQQRSLELNRRIHDLVKEGPGETLKHCEPLARDIEKFLEERDYSVIGDETRPTQSEPFLPMACMLPLKLAAWCYANLGRQEAAVAKATIALKITELERVHRFSTQTALSFSLEDLNEIQAQILQLRAQANDEAGRFDKAFVDFKAAAALLRASKKAPHDDDDDEPDCGFWPQLAFAETMMLALAKWKKDSTSRPHFSRDERQDLKRDLRLREYAEAHYKCAECGISGYEASVSLRRCTCDEVWYCSRECQRTDWKTKHKAAHRRAASKDAKDEEVETLLEDEMQPLIDDDIERRGGSLVLHHTGPELVVRDDITGQLYELISDHNVFFRSDYKMASEFTLIPKPTGCPYEQFARRQDNAGLIDKAVSDAARRLEQAGFY